MVSDSLNFVLCPSYHGATLVSLLINNHSRITHLGDTLPHRNHLDHICACKQRIDQCEFWTSLARDLDADQFSTEPSLLPTIPRLYANDALNAGANRVIATAALIFGRPVWRLKGTAGYRFRDLTMAFYRLACAMQDTDLFVDGIKSITRFFVLHTLIRPKISRVVHITRDPRAFLASWRRNLEPSAPVERVADVWLKYHRAVQLLTRRVTGVRCLLVRYEDLCRDTEGQVARLFEFLKVDQEDVIGGPRWMEKHHMIGNRMMFSFDGEVRLDTGWRDSLSALEQSRMLSLTRPLSERLGYT